MAAKINGMQEDQEISRMEESINICTSQSKTTSIGFCSSPSVVSVAQKAPLYVIAQLTGSILANGTLALLLDVNSKSYFGTVPVGSNGQSLAMEIMLMFVVCGVCTDDRATLELSKKWK
ncbi:hypothetical protein RND71_019552 [Anisodus tanguticus]|uniref:Uncharacterized protein n=1 Tax=Anisodus tanguticus TaxID=243964 RepID=A0AAE1RZJ2_9SOLA|nr:hypothetical protein RND71_019552 [Anisodus tanguticus]